MFGVFLFCVLVGIQVWLITPPKTTSALAIVSYKYDVVEFQGKNKKYLYGLAQKENISGRSKMTKFELTNALLEVTL